jgi:hypothetical protein
MAQSTDNRTLYPVELAGAGIGLADTASQASHMSNASQPEIFTSNMANNKSTATCTEPAPYFQEALEDAERLLKYAAEMGIDVDADTRDHVLEARAARVAADHVTGNQATVSQATVANLLSALTKLAASLKPVSAESLKAYNNDNRPTVRMYWKWAIWLAIVIVPFSIISFVTTAISNTIHVDITTANDLAVKLRAELGPSAGPTHSNPETPAETPKGLNQADVITQLQLYASTMRAIDARALQLNWFVLRAVRDPFAEYRWDPKKNDQENIANQKKLKTMFQLPIGLPNLPATLDVLTSTYQDDRLFAQDILDVVSVYYGAISTCLLPVLYALLGTCAYLLRTFEQQMAARTFMPSVANSARFLIAGIGGAVVGLFSNNFTIAQGTSISPLAIAFLVGYAVDVFFSFLEGLLQAFTKNRSGTSSLQPAPSSH